MLEYDTGKAFPGVGIDAEADANDGAFVDGVGDVGEGHCGGDVEDENHAGLLGEGFVDHGLGRGEGGNTSDAVETTA